MSPVAVSFVPPFRKHLLAALGLALLVVGCDQVSQPDARHPPSIAALEIMPDSINVEDLPPDQVQDSTAQVPLAISARATDPDGTVERVVFTIEPASNPRGTLSGVLAPEQGNRYRRALGLGIPITRDEVYTIRVFAVDDDSLSSNQGIGRFRFIGR